MEVNLTIPGEPKGKGRPRFSRVGAHVRTYTPEATASYENLIKVAYMTLVNFKFPDDTPLRIEIDAYFAIPKSVSKKNRELMLSDSLRPLKKPDNDNILKVVCDALNGIAYRDDVQIAETDVRKYYSDNPRIEVRIGEIVRKNDL